VKTSLVATRLFFVPFISLLFFGSVIWKLPACVIAQSAVLDDVKHDTPGQSIKPGQSVHIDVNLALVNVTVTDPYDRLVTGLEPDNFRIFEDNIEQEVVNFSSEDVPISIGVILDFSGSMANKLGKAKEAAFQFFKTADPPDEFLGSVLVSSALYQTPFGLQVVKLPQQASTVSGMENHQGRLDPDSRPGAEEFRASSS
jgi:hypothetical protein